MSDAFLALPTKLAPDLEAALARIREQAGSFGESIQARLAMRIISNLNEAGGEEADRLLDTRGLPPELKRRAGAIKDVPQPGRRRRTPGPRS